MHLPDKKLTTLAMMCSHRSAVHSLQSAIDLRSRQVSMQLVTCLDSANSTADVFIGTGK